MTSTSNNIKSRPGYDFQFDASACEQCPGHCCRGTSGYVFLSKSQIEALCDHLCLSHDDFSHRFLRKVGHRYALQEVEIEKGDFACIFLDASDGRCTVYEARPTQCRTFPFWDHFRVNPDDIDQECPGILKQDYSDS